MISITIVGSGNVGFHLAQSFLKRKQIELKQLFTRNPQDYEFWQSKVSTIDNLKLLENADVTILAISDDSIQEVSEKINNSFVVHTSGGKSINELHNKERKGVFYPLQTFSKDKEINFSEIPICVEAENDDDKNLLIKLGQTLGSQCYEIISEQRKFLHLAAVFANNFSNHMYHLANDICKTNGVPFEVLLPLIRETAHKIQSLTPSKAQTGPAIRNDQKTIEKHLNLLSDNQKELYKKITESIQKNGKKL